MQRENEIECYSMTYFSRGLGGKHCVLRTICESAASPISHKSGILGELLHILLT